MVSGVCFFDILFFSFSLVYSLWTNTFQLFAAVWPFIELYHCYKSFTKGLAIERVKVRELHTPTQPFNNYIFQCRLVWDGNVLKMLEKWNLVEGWKQSEYHVYKWFFSLLFVMAIWENRSQSVMVVFLFSKFRTFHSLFFSVKIFSRNTSISGQ